ncbi:MAG: M14 family zinc carboxypeptidase [Armatimonadota bacterium]
MSDRLTVGPAEISGNGYIAGTGRDGGRWYVHFASEPRTSPQPLWFHIEARDVGSAPVDFTWELPDICLGDRNSLHLLRPVLRADDGEWARCGEVSVEEHADGRRSLRFSHEGGADTVAAAFCFPYAPQDLDATLADLGDSWERDLIGVTHESRPLERLRLTGGHSGERPGVYFMARQHSGETPGSWVLDGILRFLSSDEDDATELRERLDVWACPFVDLDGVVNGDYGKDALPWDYNRAWEQLPMRAAVHAIQRDLLRFYERTAPRIVIDLHGPGHSTPGVYLQLPRGERPEPQRSGALDFADELAALFPELPPNRLSHETTYASRWNKLSTLGSWTWDYLGETQCVSVEASYQRLTDSLLYPADYHEIGRRVIRAAGAWLARRDGG